MAHLVRDHRLGQSADVSQATASSAVVSTMQAWWVSSAGDLAAVDLMHTFTAFTAEGAKLDSGGIRNRWNSKLLLQGGCCNLIGFGLSIQPKVLDATRKEEVVNANLLWVHRMCNSQSRQKLDLAKSYRASIASLVISDLAQVGCVLVGASALSSNRMAVRGRHVLCLAGE